VAAFLDARIGFRTITSVIERTMEGMGLRAVGNVADVLAVDREARTLAAATIAGSC
jgi:1-deoxy-D-xylulose 5-phosphate reductoisomerase